MEAKTSWRANGCNVRCRYCGLNCDIAWYALGLALMQKHQHESHYHENRKHVMSIEPREFWLRSGTIIYENGVIETGDAS